MDELLGLIDSLEATILESKKIPMTNKLVIEEDVILQLVDKLRLTVKNSGQAARQCMDLPDSTPLPEKEESLHIPEPIDQRKQQTELLEKTKKEADEIRTGAQDYAEYILANLHLMVTKMQKNLIKVEKNLETGRDLLEKKQERESK